MYTINLRPGALALAAVTVTALAVIPVVNASPAATTVTLEQGEFSWGIKSTFLGYVASPAAGGVVEGRDGARYADEQFHFPVDVAASDIDAAGNGTVDLAGEAVIQAHQGLGPAGGWGLDLRYHDLRLEIDGDNVTLTADYELSGAAGRGQSGFLEREGDDVTLVTFVLDEKVDPGRLDNVLQAPVTVAQAGITESLLNYQPGTELDKADLRLRFVEDARDPQPLSSGSSSSRR